MLNTLPQIPGPQNREAPPYHPDIDIHRHLIRTMDGSQVRLCATEWRVFLYLLEYQRPRNLEGFWSACADSKHSVRTCIMSLRKKLKNSRWEIITVRDCGHELVERPLKEPLI